MSRIDGFIFSLKINCIKIYPPPPKKSFIVIKITWGVGWEGESLSDALYYQKQIEHLKGLYLKYRFAITKYTDLPHQVTVG